MYDVYIGRPSKWGNPYSHLTSEIAKYKVKTREESLQSYADWLVCNDNLMKSMHELEGKILGCHCDPEDCHGSILAYLTDYRLSIKENEGKVGELDKNNTCIPEKENVNENCYITKYYLDIEKEHLDNIIQSIDSIVMHAEKVVIITGGKDFKELVKRIVKHRNMARVNKIYTIDENGNDNKLIYWGKNNEKL